MKRSPLTLTVAALLIIIFGLMLFVYQVRKSEVAVVTLFGNIRDVKTEPGPGLRWPWPIEQVSKLDQRVQVLEGKYEQIKLPDQNILMLGVFVGYRVSDAGSFYKSFDRGSIPEAERTLDGFVRSAKNEVAGQHPFSDFVSTDEKQMKFNQIEKEILDKVQQQLQGKGYGIEVKFVQIAKIGLPESVTKTVLDRMTSERQYYISQISSLGDKEARKVKSEADSQALITLANADAESLKIKGEGEAQMMKSLEVLQQNPGLAIFNMQMTAAEEFLRKSTLILDQSFSPLQWLRMDQSSINNQTNLVFQH
ncbi:MAG TPA: SPFH domain-containing protein [Verrucomicrobiae bacterium]|jgi:membrane protease subunit HflC